MPLLARHGLGNKLDPSLQAFQLVRWTWAKSFSIELLVFALNSTAVHVLPPIIGQTCVLTRWIKCSVMRWVASRTIDYCCLNSSLQASSLRCQWREKTKRFAPEWMRRSIACRIRSIYWSYLWMVDRMRLRRGFFWFAITSYFPQAISRL